MNKFVITALLVLILGGTTYFTKFDIQAPKTDTSNAGEATVQVKVPDITSAKPEAIVTSQPSGTPESSSVIDNVLTAVAKVSVKEGQTSQITVSDKGTVISSPAPFDVSDSFVPKVDFCKNLDGDQAEVPSGLARDENGYCWPKVAETTVSKPTTVPEPVAKQDYLGTRGGAVSCAGRITETTNYFGCFVKPSSELSNTYYTLTVTNPITNEVRTVSQTTDEAGVYLEVNNVWANTYFSHRLTLDNERFSSAWVNNEDFIKN